MPKHQILVALDGMSESRAVALAQDLQGIVAGFKVNDLIYACRYPICDRLAEYGEVMADPKLNDIPTTMFNCAHHFRRCEFLTAHASNTSTALQEVVRAVPKTCVLGVTVLTSISDDSKIKDDRCKSIFGDPIMAAVQKFARKAQRSGFGGIVCSAHELKWLSKLPEIQGMKFIVPAVRSPQADHHDQKRVMTPAEAIALGAYRVVIGREITNADDPIATAERINADIAASTV